MKNMKNIVYSYHCDNLSKTIAVMTYLRSIGYAISTTSRNPDIELAAREQLSHYKYMFIYPNCMTTGGSHSGPGDRTQLTFEQVFEFDLAKYQPRKYGLNNEYIAEIQEDGSVKVGCQTFKADVILGLAAEVKKQLDKQ